MVINIQDDILRLRGLGLLELLLKDKATGGNILWATDAYAEHGDGYGRGEEIRTTRITGENSDLIKTRARRAMEQRTERTRQHAEVFTPLRIVKKMCDFADEQWFGRKDGIYKLTDESKIYFSKQKHWKLYVDARRLEITCGEAPFLATRYDVETGEAIPVEERLGLLDRKLRAVSENARDMEEWKTWALRAVQATYGYELQGDNLLIARVNILCTAEEHFVHRWRQKPDKPFLEKLSRVIAWNLWQMDGIKGCVPVPPTPTEQQLSLFPTSSDAENLFGERDETPISCRLYNWRGDRSLSYTTLREKGSKVMKFDFIIGNPPYQEDAVGDNENYAPQLYNKFMDESFLIADAVELIHPGRFLFDAGSTPKAWNKKMLSDPHFKILHYEADSKKIFSNVQLTGGVAISYHDTRKNYGAIGVFTPFSELNTILHKVTTHSSFEGMDKIVVSRTIYRLSEKLHSDHPEAITQLSKGHAYDMASNIFERLPQVFFDEKPSDDFTYVKMLGREGGERAYKYVRREYIKPAPNLDYYKIVLARADGAAGTIGNPIPARVLGSAVIEGPKVGTTESFLSIGMFSDRETTENTLHYVMTKFCRTMVGVLKTTQDITPDKWKYVPLQDFTPNSDIDWSKSIPEIDQQLYRKYGLEETEIAFIESHVKPMT